MSNCADTARFRVGRSADVLYICSSMLSSVMQKPRFLAKEEKQISQPQTEMVVGLETEKDMQDEHMRRASVILLFQFVIPASRSRCQRQISRENIAG